MAREFRQHSGDLLGCQYLYLLPFYRRRRMHGSYVTGHCSVLDGAAEHQAQQPVRVTYSARP